jgi:hypothetical protein
MVIQTLLNHACLTAFTTLLYWILSRSRQNLLPISIVPSLLHHRAAPLTERIQQREGKAVGKIPFALPAKGMIYQVLYK